MRPDGSTCHACGSVSQTAARPTEASTACDHCGATLPLAGAPPSAPVAQGLQLGRYRLEASGG